MTKKELFLELAKPDENGKSEWIHVSDFRGRYEKLSLGNGGDFCRKNSSLAKVKP